ncbi:MAG: hypothetical protein U0840_05555 [Gemmataceae bacterium]
MEWLFEIRLIRLFSFYLAVVFVLGTYIRLRQYRAVLSLVLRLRSRWPNLTQLILTHRNILLTRGNYLPLVLVLLLLAGNMLASRLVWPQADHFRVQDLAQVWPAIPVLLLTGLAMMVFDGLGIVRVGHIDEPMLEGYLDQAEGWLSGWKAPVVRILSVGYINPRTIVSREVANALEKASDLLNYTLWWVSIQTTLRILFGLSLWCTYAILRYLEPIVG